MIYKKFELFIIPLKLTELAIMKRIHHRFWWENILILPFFAKELQFDSECELFLWRWIQDRKNVKFGRSFSVKLHDLNRCGFFECQSQESCLFFVVAGKDLTRLDCYYLKLSSLKWLLSTMTMFYKLLYFDFALDRLSRYRRTSLKEECL